MGRKDNFPPKLREKLEKRGYFALKPEDRVEAGKKFLQTLRDIKCVDHEAALKSLRALRGDDG